MGGTQSAHYTKLPARPATFGEVISADPMGIAIKIIGYGDTEEEALDELNEEACLRQDMVDIEPIPDHDEMWHCGFIHHPGMFANEWLYNTIFFGTDTRTERKCAWFYWGITVAGTV